MRSIEAIRRKIKILREILKPLEKLEQRDYMENLNQILETRGEIKALLWVLDERSSPGPSGFNRRYEEKIERRES